MSKKTVAKKHNKPNRVGANALNDIVKHKVFYAAFGVVIVVCVVLIVVMLNVANAPKLSLDDSVDISGDTLTYDCAGQRKTICDIEIAGTYNPSSSSVEAELRIGDTDFGAEVELDESAKTFTIKSETGVEAASLIDMFTSVATGNYMTYSYNNTEYTLLIKLLGGDGKEQLTQTYKLTVEFDKTTIDTANAKAKSDYQKAIASAGSVGYDDLFRNSANYKGKYLRFTGAILQTDDSGTYCRVGISKTNYSYISNYYNGNEVLYVSPCKSDSGKLLEDDVITFVGIGNGTRTYTTVMGATIEIPSVKGISETLQVVGKNR